tara:strand:- start:127 stop:264 length:138 start_codon:yes stop_codon:yes gene_type:complete
MPTIEVNDDTKRILKNFKKFYEKKHGKLSWKYFMNLLVIKSNLEL